MFTKKISEVAKITGASETFVRSLVEKGALKAQRHSHHGPHGFMMLVECDSIESLKSNVHSHAKKTLGKKHASPKPKKQAPHVAPKPVVINGGVLDGFATWRDLEPAKRELLMKLAECRLEDLEAFIGLIIKGGGR